PSRPLPRRRATPGSAAGSKPSSAPFHASFYSCEKFHLILGRQIDPSGPPRSDRARHFAPFCCNTGSHAATMCNPSAYERGIARGTDCCVQESMRTVVLFFCWAPAALLSGQTPEIGRAQYESHCSKCHGRD